MPKMRREEKLDLILLARYLERQAGNRHGKAYSRNIGRPYSTIRWDCPALVRFLRPDKKPLREGVIFYYQGWGWRVRKGWREAVKAIECTNSRIYTPNA
jgi:hypothetical protein